MSTFTIITEGGSKLELDTNMSGVVFSIGDKMYEVTIKER